MNNNVSKDHPGLIIHFGSFQECSRYMSPNQISDFLDGAIRNRISVRLIAEQHIALSHAMKDSQRNEVYVGVVNLACSPYDTIRMCESFVSELCNATLGASPSIVIDGYTDATFAYAAFIFYFPNPLKATSNRYVPVHLEYILTEVLKNSFRATVEEYYKLPGSKRGIPPVVITISPPPLGVSHDTKFLSMRVRDQGGGVSPNNMACIFSYAFTTAGPGSGDGDETDVERRVAPHVEGTAVIGSGGSIDGNLFGEITRKGVQSAIGTIAGLGYGLPMSNLYAKSVTIAMTAVKL